MDGSRACRFLGSTLGLKILMAVTGIILFGFVVGHVAGNLLVFAGPKAMDDYAAFLKSKPAFLWGARAVLLLSVFAHFAVSVRLTRRKGEARPVAYEGKKPHGSTYASRTMMWSGPIVGLFVIYHLMHFTFGNAHPTKPFNPGTVYNNVVVGFQHPGVALAYIVAMIALGLHLSHGLWSVLQTIGVNRPHLERGLRKFSILVSAAVMAGFVAIPLAVALKILKVA
jgi:succinate dehydrogenase / fumarate reductase cytochrome b subunit